jgi:hypothetical protein
MPPTMTTTPQPNAITGAHFDYIRQAWTIDGRYVACGHSRCQETTTTHRCYGTVHAGETAPPENLPTVQVG